MGVPFEDFHVAENNKIRCRSQGAAKEVRWLIPEPRFDPYLVGRIRNYGVAIAWWV